VILHDYCAANRAVEHSVLFSTRISDGQLLNEIDGDSSSVTRQRACVCVCMCVCMCVCI
jgi:hypothetical protein